MAIAALQRFKVQGGSVAAGSRCKEFQVSGFKFQVTAELRVQEFKVQRFQCSRFSHRYHR